MDVTGKKVAEEIQDENGERKKEGGTKGDDAATIKEDEGFEDPKDRMNPDKLQFPELTPKHL